jgi:hypothetical protein
MKTAMLAWAVALGLALDPDYAKLVVLPETLPHSMDER